MQQPRRRIVPIHVVVSHVWVSVLASATSGRVLQVNDNSLFWKMHPQMGVLLDKPLATTNYVTPQATIVPFAGRFGAHMSSLRMDCAVVAVRVTMEWPSRLPSFTALDWS